MLVFAVESVGFGALDVLLVVVALVAPVLDGPLATDPSVLSVLFLL